MADDGRVVVFRRFDDPSLPLRAEREKVMGDAPLERVEQKVDALADRINNLGGQIEALANGQKVLTEGHQKLTEGHQKLVEGHQRLVEGHQKLIDGQQKLTDGLQKLVGGQQELVHGQRKLFEGQQTLTDGQQKLTLLYESLRGDFETVTEGVVAANGRIDRLDEKVEAGFSEIKTTLDLFVSGQGGVNRAVEQRLQALEQRLP